MRELLERMDAREIAAWKAYHEIEPFGQDRHDVGAAIVAHTIALANGAKDTKPSDFLPSFGGEAPARPTGEQLKAKALAFVARLKAHKAGGRS